MAIRHASDADNALIDELNKLVDDVADFLANGWNSMLTQLDGDAGLTETDYNATFAVTSAAVGLVRSSNRPGTLKTLRAPGAVRGFGHEDAATTRRVFGSQGDGSLQTELNAVQTAVAAILAQWPGFIVQLEADNANTDYDPTLPNTLTSAQIQRGTSAASDPSEDGGRGGAGAGATKVEASGTNVNTDGTLASRSVDPVTSARMYHVDGDDAALEVINECRADLIELLGALGARGLLGVVDLLDDDTGVTETTYEADNAPATATQTEDLVRSGDHPNSSDVAL